MRILIVGMIDSVHVARWVSQISGQGWELIAFPSTSDQMHPMLKELPVRTMYFDRLKVEIAKRKNPFFRKILSLSWRIMRNVIPQKDRCAKLASTIRKAKPDIVHSLETQHAGYLVLETKERFFQNAPFPAWLHTNWGSDFFIFGRLPEHQERIGKVLASCDYYSCEGLRDVRIARELGFTKKAFDPFPNTGGFDIEAIRGSSHAVAPSRRKAIILKGYQGWAGRALVGIKALDLVSKILGGYRVLIFGNPEGVDVAISAGLLATRTGITIEVLPQINDYSQMLGLFASARIYIGLSIGDAISTSLLEAMAMGAFPIQSNSSMADEWIKDGETGAIVPPEEPNEIAKRIREALMDDELVDKAAIANWQVIVQRADAKDLAGKAIAIYEEIFAARRDSNALVASMNDRTALGEN
jgi:glycosyltransferase involved in cell wall biosynthesis